MKSTEPVALVVYQCVVKGCGLRLAGIVNDNGRPLAGYWASNQLGVGGTESTWLEDWHIDEPKALLANQSSPKLVDAVYVVCRRHGPWTIPRQEMLDHWRKARASEGFTVKLDNSSPWKSTDLY